MSAQDQIQLYCPKCGDLLVRSGDTLKCVRGEIEFSGELCKRFKEYYLENPSPEKKAINVRIGGRWFCPGCGVEIVERSTGAVECQNCSKSLLPFIHVLIERHPHKDSDGVWR